MASSDVPSPPELGALAVRLAEGAAGVVREGRRAGFGVDAKSTATDLVTGVDRETERWLVAEIARRRPDDGVLGEEGGGHAGSSGVRWVVDPIDGTVNFVLGLPQYAVSVAAEVDGEVVAGAVANPATGETFRAVAGGGAWLGEQRLSGPRDVPLSGAVVATGFAYASDTRARQVAALAPLLPRIADIRRMGSSALDLCAVAAGTVDAYYEAGLSAWDFAAGALVAREAGCLVTDLGTDAGAAASGTYFRAACRPAIADDFASALREVGAHTVLS